MLPIGSSDNKIKTQGKEKLRATIVFMIGFSYQGIKKAKPFIIFKGEPDGNLAHAVLNYNNNPEPKSFIAFQSNAWAD